MTNLVNSLPTTKGEPRPFGAAKCDKGINFAIHSKEAARVTLCLFKSPDALPLYEIELEEKTDDTWHVCLPSMPDGLFYAYRIKTGTEDEEGLPYLLDPYAKGILSSHEWIGHSEKSRYHPLGIVLPQEEFDWQGVRRPGIAMKDLVLYEMHVRGFTQSASSDVENPGKFLGVVEKIPYLKQLGVNAVKLLPIHEFNESENHRINPVTYQRLFQYWGYSTVNYFSPMNRYASGANPGAAIVEFKKLVRELHRHGIEVILDVVFNHTAEGNDQGPVISFKGIDKHTYYIVSEDGKLRDFTGCGNTFNCNHPVAMELIQNALRYWATEMQVDGFRFDLASIFYRDVHGDPLASSPLVEALSKDPVLEKIKLIAEPWDAAGMYQVGKYFPESCRWSEWNGKYRDSIRRFIKGIPGEKREFATRLCGSEDLYYNRSPVCSINFVTAHDGFTLSDLVSYNQKHNIENGEENRDGMDQNDSWNCGTEGPTLDKRTAALRERQKRNFILGLLISQGVPMLQMGDEYSHTKKGNNNTWCQNNELNWFLWDAFKNNQGFFRFYQKMIHFRLAHPILRQGRFLSDQDIQWHGMAPFQPDWDGAAQFLAFTLKDHDAENDIYAAFNVREGQANILLPPPPEGKLWHLVVNTACLSPQDFIDEGNLLPIGQDKFRMQSHSAILLKALEE